MSRPAGSEIPLYSAVDDIAEIATALDKSGCVVITDVMSVASLEGVKKELAPFMAKAALQPDNPADFYPGLTRRVTALPARSEIVQGLVKHPTSLALCEHHLCSNSEHFQLHATAALEIGPGARSQMLHREEDPFSFFKLPRPNLVIASIWAVSDFTASNGATCLVPGSHRWSEERKPTSEEIVIAEMPAGSVLFWVGGLLHGAGANISENWRYGIILTYSCGWLRQEENQYLDFPRDKLRQLDPELRKILGFTMHGALGYHDPTLGTP